MFNLIFRILKFKHSIIYFQSNWERIISYGFYGIFTRLLKKVCLFFFSVILIPASLLLYFFGYRRLCIFTERIGHLAIEPDILIKSQILGLIKSQRWFLLAPPHRVANEHLLGYWENFFRIYRSPCLCFFLHSLSFWSFMQYNTSNFINSNYSQLAYRINTLWANRNPLLKLTSEDVNWGIEQIKKLGIPEKAWFVCVHAREEGYSKIDEKLHSHRNSNIENLIPAIKEITRRGGWVIRIGDSTMKPLKEIHQVKDYAHHTLRNARLDIILCARARFILGNTSGIFLVGSIFGVPCALANMIPIPTLGLNPDDISIPKKLWHLQENRYLTIEQIMNSPISTFRCAQFYIEHNIRVMENSSCEIFHLVVEMLNSLEGSIKKSKEDIILQKYFISLIKPIHYSYGTSSNISFSFLKMNRHLLKCDLKSIEIS